jgi:hypothetical protein
LTWVQRDIFWTMTLEIIIDGEWNRKKVRKELIKKPLIDLIDRRIQKLISSLFFMIDAKEKERIRFRVDFNF